MDLKKKVMKLGKSGGTIKRSRQRNINTTNQQENHDLGNNWTVKLTNFPSETWAMLLPEVNHWFIQIKKTEAAGESINVNDGGQYSGKSRKSNKQSRTTNKSKDEGNDEASTSKDD